MNAEIVLAAVLTSFGALPAAVPTPQDPPPAPAPAPAPAPPQIPECADTKTTASGLQYCVLAKGRDEPSPGPQDLCVVHYTGWLTNGTVFDSSRQRGEPATFRADQVIKGWTEALQLMTPGARFKVTIPPALGYGSQSTGQIPPDSTLVFDVELIGVKPVPKFRAATPDKQKDLEGGGKYEIVEQGTGAAVGEKDGLAMRYAIWRPNGEMAECSEWSNDHRLGGTVASLPFDFLKQLAKVMKVGDVVRAEIPKQQFPNLGSDSVWELEITGTSHVPPFRPCDPAKSVTTQSGLVYEVIEPGTGASPKATDTVSALYTGWLTDGTMFDSAHARGTPLDFPLNRVIKGWTEGLQLMKVGGKFLFTIPPEIGYGKRGSPPTIPADATLVFLVELVAVKDGAPR